MPSLEADPSAMQLKLNPNPALLIVDMQNTFCHKDGVFVKCAAQIPPETISRIVNTVNGLREAFHRKHLPVIYVGYSFSADYSEAGILFDNFPVLPQNGYCLRGSWDAAIVDELKPDPSRGEIVIEKYKNTAFYGSELEKLLRERAVEQLVVTGCATNVCVESTVRDACAIGFRCVTVSDGTGTLSEEEHQASLRNLGYFGGVTSRKDVEEALERLGSMESAKTTTD